MLSFFENIVKFIADLISGLGYWGVSAGMLLESSCIPIPSEVILPLAGNMVAEGKISMLVANITVALGSIAGSLLAYSIGYYGGRPFILKYGKYFFVSESHFYKADKTFNKYGSAAVFFGRLLPVIRTFISLPAGIARMDLKKFLTYSLIGMLPWNFTLILLGDIFGKKYEAVIRPIFKRYEYLVLAAIVLAILFFIVRHFVKGKKAVA
jgi:membrane protein DedA with SNARE-associated domain